MNFWIFNYFFCKVFIIKPKLIEANDSLGYKVKKKIIGIKLLAINDQLQKQTQTPSKALYYSLKEVWFVTITSLEYVGKIFN